MAIKHKKISKDKKMVIFKNLDINKNYCYKITEANFGKIRMGDLIAIAGIVTAVKKQYGTVNISCELNDYLLPVFKQIKNSFMYFNYKQKHIPFPIFNVNCWSLYNYIYNAFSITTTISLEKILKDVNIANKYVLLKRKIFQLNKKTVLFIPLFPTINNNYNKDRFFTIDFCFDFIKEISKYFHVIVNSHQTYYYKKLKFKLLNYNSKNISIFTNKNILEILYLASLSDLYVGGDTGISHIFASIDKYANKLLFLYGKNSHTRHNHIDINATKYALIEEYCKTDYTPKCKKNKKYKILYCDFNQYHTKHIVNETLSML